ncbi:MAG: hypothetical protein R6W83_10245 [Cryobacterium sp.]
MPERASEAVISVAGVDVDGLNVSASGYVSGVVENGGQCSFLFIGGDDGNGAAMQQVATATALANVTTTSCGLVQVPMTDLTPGTWQLVLTYSSDALNVSSAPTILEIP